MPDKERSRKIIKALNHDFRKKLLERIAAGKVTYTELLNLSGVESGYLAYHLRIMADLLKKNEDGYTLTPLGVEAVSLLRGRVEVQQTTTRWPRIAATALIVVILVSTIYYAYTVSTIKQVGEARVSRRQALLNQTFETMELIVSAFEYVEIPRTVWIDILVQATLLRRDLEAMKVDDDPLVSTPLVQNLDYFLGEATRTLSESDETYSALSRENRQLLRDLHYSLFILKKSLEQPL